MKFEHEGIELFLKPNTWQLSFQHIPDDNLDFDSATVELRTPGGSTEAASSPKLITAADDIYFP